MNCFLGNDDGLEGFLPLDDCAEGNVEEIRNGFSDLPFHDADDSVGLQVRSIDLKLLFI